MLLHRHRQKEKTSGHRIIHMILLFLVCQLFLGVILGCPVQAAEEHEWNGFKYTAEYGKITITGYEGDATNLTIPSTIDGMPVIAIRSSSFGYHSAIQTVSIPNTVTEIDAYTFENCTSLVSVTGLSNIKRLGGYAFAGCTSLQKIDLPHCETIDGGAFSNCIALDSISLPVCKTIGGSAFYNTKKLKEINLSNIESIDGAFSGSGIQKVTLGSHVKSIQNAFHDAASLTTINLPKGIENICGAFAGCTSLKQIDLPSSLNDISYAFIDSGLTSVNIPNSLFMNTNQAFGGCASLVSVTLHCTQIGEYTFSDCKNLIYVTIGSEVTTIDSWAYRNCSSLTEITIPDTVKSISDKAFEGCERFVKIKGSYNSEAERFAKTIGVTFEGTQVPIKDTAITLSQTSYTYTGKACKPKVVIVHNDQRLKQGTDYKLAYKNNTNAGTAKVIITGIGKYVGSTTKSFEITADTSKIYKSGNLRYKITSNSKKTVKAVSMVSKNKTSVTIPATVKIAGSSYKVTAFSASVFKNNKNLKTVVIGKNITSVPSKAFYGCSKLSKISVKGTVLKKVGSNALKGVKKGIKIEVPKKYYGSYKKLWNKKGVTVKYVKK